MSSFCPRLSDENMSVREAAAKSHSMIGDKLAIS
jgi:hypothetical protein